MFLKLLWFRVLQNLLFRMLETDHPFDVFVIERRAPAKLLPKVGPKFVTALKKDTCYNFLKSHEN